MDFQSAEWLEACMSNSAYVPKMKNKIPIILAIGIFHICILLIFVQWMFHLPFHKRIGVLLKDTQAGAGAEIDQLAVIIRAWKFGWVFDLPAAGGFEFRQWRWGGLCQIFEILFEFM